MIQITGNAKHVTVRNLEALAARLPPYRVCNGLLACSPRGSDLPFRIAVLQLDGLAAAALPVRRKERADVTSEPNAVGRYPRPP